ncbi:LOB domain-containing protein 2 [Linum perenne]
MRRGLEIIPHANGGNAAAVGNGGGGGGEVAAAAVGATHSACASCKHQRKKCAEDCILAPVFPAEKTREFQAVHKVFGVSNVIKMMRRVEARDRERVAESLVWEANSREHDPVLGAMRQYHRVVEEKKQLEKELCLYKSAAPPPRYKTPPVVNSWSTNNNNNNNNNSNSNNGSGVTSNASNGNNNLCSNNNNNENHQNQMMISNVVQTSTFSDHQQHQIQMSNGKLVKKVEDHGGSFIGRQPPPIPQHHLLQNGHPHQLLHHQFHPAAAHHPFFQLENLPIPGTLIKPFCFQSYFIG